ncbi:hypothetical protein L8C07_05205 [Paenibacillus sp. CMAA1739]|uniref:hypothetical protein n=1 Tax=Paenibacillus ottowii TaxID=2315729 RepID=UPI002DB674AE|nr:hypothetical protein [Paenibacillus sp. CMAA1739]MEC4565334.1 hypothetical protein [Paenibacillus sp. CMAA1739]
MPTVNSFAELEKLLKQKIASSLQVDVANTVKTNMEQSIEENVYDVYTPTFYDRQRDQGGLTDERNMIVDMIGQDIVSIESHRMDGSKNVGLVVETGQGYDFEFAYSGRPRPFVEKTVEELHNTKAHVAALHRGLSRQGLDVEVK